MTFATQTLWNFCGNFYTVHYFCLATFCYNSVQELNNLFAQTALALSTAIDAKDSYTHGHSERVQCRGTQFDPDIKIAFLQFLCYEILQVKSHLLTGISLIDIKSKSVIQSTIRNNWGVTQGDYYGY